MAKVVQIKNEEVLNEIIEGNAVYMLTKLREDTLLEEIIEAEAFVKLEHDETSEEPERNNDDAEAVQEEKSEKGKKKVETMERSNAVDHGKIVACYRAGRSIAWIADEAGCTYQTVVNHLKKEGIYKK